MFYVVLGAVIMLFLGATFFADFLRENPVFFLMYWAACAWLTLLSVLMALFDLLMVRAAARSARKNLEKQFLDRAEQGGEEKPRE